MENNGNDPWAYLAVLGVVNLNTFFNALVTGVTNGQVDYQGLIDEMALMFFPWKNPHFALGDAAFWIVAVITALAAFGTFGAVELAVALVGVGAFAGAAIQQVTLALTPSNGFASETATKLGAFASLAGSSTRKGLEEWANSTFAGEPDAKQNTIMQDLPFSNFQKLLRASLMGGSYLGDNIPSNNDIEEFYKKQLISRTVNSEWRQVCIRLTREPSILTTYRRTQKTFIYFAKTDDPNDSNGPNVTKYYSEEDGGVYYLYRYVEDHILQGHLDKPWGLDAINGPHYNIAPSDITKSSALAWRRAGFNYTQDIAKDRILESITSNGTLTPFKDGAAWEGVWTIPVCDVGNHTNWNVQYGGKKKHRYDYLPCCCGPDCKDTKDFVKAANLKGFQTLLRGCKAQLKVEGMDYSKVDYGFAWKNSFPLAFAAWHPAVRAGVVIGIVAGSLLFLCICALAG
ncbi:hypothetical protein FGG08_004604 [Glutinoglossum americanum]|uniref:Uncharacterized protein n=1 Tax=Glutinoglossum americanum TaxID=1670608 RepID=A0A9P8KZD5_9PEZI|nr:hypothetical protein FGG08_004604 [Glutinoglossum americanum]